MNSNKPCTSLKEKDYTFAFNGDVSAKFDDAFMPVMLGVQFCLIATKSLYDRRVLIYRDWSFAASSCQTKKIHASLQNITTPMQLLQIYQHSITHTHTPKVSKNIFFFHWDQNNPKNQSDYLVTNECIMIICLFSYDQLLALLL